MIMHDFDVNNFKQLKDEQDKYNYIICCRDETINTTEHMRINEHSSEKYILALITKKFTSGFHEVFNDVFILHKSPDIMKKALDMYVKNKWITESNYRYIAYAFISKYNTSSIAQYLCDFFKKQNIELNFIQTLSGVRDILNNIGSSFVHVENLIWLINYYFDNKFDINKNIFINHVISCYYYKIAQHHSWLSNKLIDPHYEDKFLKLFDICIQYNIDVIDDTALYYISHSCENWTTLKYMIDYYLTKKYKLYENIKVIFTIGERFGIDENKYILDYLQENNVDVNKLENCPHFRNNLDTPTYFDAVLKNNSIDMIKYTINRGVKIQNNVHRIRVDCPECYNGELSDCNYRNITSNYVSLYRFGAKINDLFAYLYSNCDNNDFHAYYSDFVDEADNDEIFDEPMIKPKILSLKNVKETDQFNIIKIL